MNFIYVKVPLPGSKPKRQDDLHAALDAALLAQSVGALLSWGDSTLHLSADAAKSPPTHHRIDIEVLDLYTGRQVLHAALVAAGVPPGTEVHYTECGEALQDVLGPAGWDAAQPSTGTTWRRLTARRS